MPLEYLSYHVGNANINNQEKLPMCPGVDQSCLATKKHVLKTCKELLGTFDISELAVSINQHGACYRLGFPIGALHQQ